MTSTQEKLFQRQRHLSSGEKNKNGVSLEYFIYYSVYSRSYFIEYTLIHINRFHFI